MKPRVLIVNKFFYPRGGDCVCTINLERLLRENGHATAVFSMDYPENIESGWNGYFASEVDFSGSLPKKAKAFRRMMGQGDISKSFNKILDEFKPDIVHLNNIHSYLSPQLALIAKQRGIKVVWTLHDYKLICPSYLCQNNGRPCEACFKDKTQVVRKKCMKGSLVASLMAYFEARKWNRRLLEQNVDKFICPSHFMASKMQEGGFDGTKMTTICNFLDFDKAKSFESLPVDERGDYYCYIGRISEEKGVELLVKTAAQLPHTLMIAGDGPLLEKLQLDYASKPNIVFLGRQSAQQVADLLAHAKFSVMPSTCYDNNPLGVIESLCAGTPAIGANIGGIPELIDENVSGLIFKPGKVEPLRQAIRDAMRIKWDNAAIKGKALLRFSASAHYVQLTEAYK